MSEGFPKHESPQQDASDDTPSRLKDMVKEAARAAVFYSALMGPSQQQNVSEHETEPSTGGTPTEQVSKTLRDPAAIEAHILTQLPDAKDPEQITELLELLKQCPSCGKERDLRTVYATILFERLPGREALRLSHYADVLPEKDRKRVLTKAIMNVTDTMEGFDLLIPATFKNYTPLLTHRELSGLVINHLVRFPLSFARTIGTDPEIRTILHTEEDRLRSRFAMGDVRFEELTDDLFAELTETYGEKATATLLATWEIGGNNVLHGVSSEIARTFDLSTIEQIFVTDGAISVDPYTLLAILHERGPREGDARFESLMTQAIEHVSGFAYPQVTLREAENLHTYLRDRESTYSLMIIDAMDACVSQGSYRALVEYYDRYARHVVDAHRDLMRTILGDAASAAYDAGDLTAFISLYSKLDPEIRNGFEEKYVTMLEVERREMSESVRERYGLKLDPEQPFESSHLPFPKHEMEQYLTRLVRRSIEATTLRGEHWKLHDREFARYYGHSFISIPLEDLKSVLFHEEFAQALASTDLRLSYANVFMLAESVWKLAHGVKGERATSIARATHETLAQLKEHLHDVVLGPGVKTIIATHEEASFDPEILRKRLHAGSGGFENDFLFIGKGVRMEKDVNVIKRDFLHTVKTARKGQTTIILSGHGSPENFALSRNTAESLDRSLRSSPYNISYQELGDAIVQARNPELRIMVFACYSYDFLRNLTDHIVKKGGFVPAIEVSETNENRIGFYLPVEKMTHEQEVSRFDPNEVIETIIEHLYEKNEQALTVKDLQTLQGKFLETHGLKVFLGKNPNKTRPTDKKVDRKKQIKDRGTRSKAGTGAGVLEIVREDPNAGQHAPPLA